MILAQKGFTLIEVLLIIIALSLVSGVGYYVYNANKESNNKQTATSGQNQKEEAVAQDEAPKKKYLMIKEAGVKFELSDKIKDAYYYVNEQGFIYISVRHFDNLKGFEGCTARGHSNSSGGGMVALSSAKVGDEHFNGPWTETSLKEFGAVNIDNKFYWFEHNSQAPCYDPDTIPQNDVNVAKIGEFKQAFADQQKTITKL